MNTQTGLAKQEKPSALSTMAARFNVEPAKLLVTLKNTVFKGASDDELMALVIVANEYNLNPLKKEIYAFPAKGGGIVPVVGVDGWISIMNSRPAFDGVEFEMEFGEDAKPVSCTATIFVKERSRPVRVTEYFEECKRNTDPWNSMPRRMLRNRALAQCVRIAFTAGGIIDEDEVQQMLDPVANAKPIRGTVVSDETRYDDDALRRNALGSKKAQVIAWMDGDNTIGRKIKWDEIAPILAENKILENVDSIAGVDDLNDEQAASIFGSRSGCEIVLKKKASK